MRLCPGCGVQMPYPGRGPCEDCRRERERARVRGTRRQRGYTDQWLQLVKVAIAQQPYCSACATTSDLTGDHRVPVSRGGASTLENIEVLCRRCNSSKGSRLGRREAGFLSSDPEPFSSASRETKSVGVPQDLEKICRQSADGKKKDQFRAERAGTLAEGRRLLKRLPLLPSRRQPVVLEVPVDD